MGATLTGKFKDYIHFQESLVPYMTNDIQCILRFAVLPPDTFSSYIQEPREAVTFNVNESIVHLKTNDDEYIIYVPTFEWHGPKIDLIVTNSPSAVIKQFDFKCCSNYIDMKNERLVITCPADTCLRCTDMNDTDRNNRVLNYFRKLADDSRYSSFLLQVFCANFSYSSLFQQLTSSASYLSNN